MSWAGQRRAKRCAQDKHVWGIPVGTDWIPLAKYHTDTKKVDHLVECKYCRKKKKPITPLRWFGSSPGGSNPKMTIEYKAIIL